MKRLHITMLILFIASALLLGGVLFYKHYTTDTTMPEIRIDEEPLQLSVADGTDALMQGVSAYDEKDGDITDNLILQKIEMVESGEVVATYAVADGDSHVVTRTRTIVYTDYVSPRFSLSKELRYSPTGSIQVRDRLTATDVIDGDISASIRINTNNLSPYYAGIYPVTFEVTNSLGDHVSLTLDVEIRTIADNEPVITLDTYLVYMTKEESKSFKPKDYVKEVTGADIKDVYTDKSRLSTGVNRVTYSCRNEIGVRGSAVLYIVVE
jgi:hypothetical protein